MAAKRMPHKAISKRLIGTKPKRLGEAARSLRGKYGTNADSTSYSPLKRDSATGKMIRFSGPTNPNATKYRGFPSTTKQSGSQMQEAARLGKRKASGTGYGAGMAKGVGMKKVAKKAAGKKK